MDLKMKRTAALLGLTLAATCVGITGAQAQSNWRYRDRDRDGIPNYRDPNPDRPNYGYRARSRDIDRDGIPNWRDPNPYRPNGTYNYRVRGWRNEYRRLPSKDRIEDMPGDWDGDGIPNRRDHHPRNPNRG
jgi:hypothetical protein